MVNKNAEPTNPEESFSLPLTWILLILIIALILGIFFSWWWIAGLVAIYFSIGIISIFIRGRDNTID